MATNDSVDWGVINSQGNSPRQLQFGGRIRY
jgi:hypothetical protein